jgi:MarR family transcriptional regulator for hemolysin
MGAKPDISLVIHFLDNESRRIELFERSASAGHLTSWAARLFARSLDRRLKPIGISIGQVPVLLLLAEHDGLSQKELVNGVAIEQPAMVAILNRMEAGGLLRRRADPTDRRARIFYLSDQARPLLAPLAEALDEGNVRALRGFSAREHTLLMSMLHRIIRNMTE